MAVARPLSNVTPLLHRSVRDLVEYYICRSRLGSSILSSLSCVHYYVVLCLIVVVPNCVPSSLPVRRSFGGLLGRRLPGSAHLIK